MVAGGREGGKDMSSRLYLKALRGLRLDASRGPVGGRAQRGEPVRGESGPAAPPRPHPLPPARLPRQEPSS